MKLAFCLFKYFPYGGLQRDFLRIALECQRRGHTIDIYTMEWQGDIPKDFRVIIIPTQGIWNHRRASSFSKQLPNYLKKNRYDLVVGFNKISGLDVYYAADLCYAAAHAKSSIFYRLTERYRTYRKLEKAVFAPNQSTEILLIAEREQAYFTHFYQTPAERFHLLPPGINRDFIRPENAIEIRASLRKTLQINTDEYCVLMVGSSFKTKGVDRALYAIQALPDELRQKTYLCISGSGDAKPYARLAQRLNITDRVQFLGGRDDIGQLLLAADLLLHPAYSENTGTVLLEALVAGLPILTTETCGYAKYIQQARAGAVLTLPFQQTALNQQLADILNAPLQRAAWQKNALNYAAKMDLYSLVEHAVDLIERPKKNHMSLEKIFQLKGEFFRQQKNRATLRVEINNKLFFVKRHKGIGWHEILKNLLQFRLPVISAKNEWLAIQKLTELNIPTTALVDYGEQGSNPAAIQSFIVTEEITNTTSLEYFCRTWPQQPPSFTLKRKLITAVANIARTLHTNGINHRDFYLCHFLLDNNIQHKLKLYLIDLHRAQCRRHTPQRAVIKDIAGLYFSSLDIGLSKRDLLRFIKNYSGTTLKYALSVNKSFWKKINKRALRLYAKIEKKTLAAITIQKNAALPNFAFSSTDNLLHCEQLLRIIPNKRWVFFAHWNQQPVVAKLFTHARHAMRELQGYQALIDTDIRTPSIVFHDWSRGGNFYIVLYERVQPAQDLAALWSQSDSTTQQQLLTDLLLLIAQHHQAGIKQRDLHFKNFLLSNNTLYTLDTADIVKHSGPLDMRDSLKNLALLLAQLPPNYNMNLEQNYRLYLQTRGLPFTLSGLTDLKKWIAHWHTQRLRAYGRKVFRNSTAFIAQKTWQQFSVYDRTYDTEAMRIFLADPEAVLQGPKVKLLKLGHSSTVALIEISGQKLVVKRYNIKSFWHGIRRAVQNTRAAISWRNAHCLSLMNIFTAKPIAIVEKRFGPLRSTSYFISEYVAGTELESYFQETNSQEEQLFISEKILVLLNRLADLKISHGDLKATNILMIGTEPLLLDLDAMHQHRCAWRWRKAQQRDQKRFLKNWDNKPDIKKIFVQLSN